jgi:predicted glycoside hydrolase/deacetylase ChbG (UPF0249 family)
MKTVYTLYLRHPAARLAASSSRMQRRRVIVNADDFGWSAGVTEGILQAHREGVVTSASLAVNMPAAQAAVRRLVEAPRLGVGLHLNASQGPPLSREGAALAGPDGWMNRTAAGVVLACAARPRLLQAVEAEFDAQIRWALDQGIRPTHLDTHRHSHAYAPIFLRVAHLAQRYRIRFVRRYGERLPGRDWPAAPAKQRCIGHALNVLGRANAARSPGLHGTQGLWGVAHTGLIDARWLVLAAERAPPGVTEIMTHPGLPDKLAAGETRLVESRQAELAALCDPNVRRAFAGPSLELVHYGDL